MIAYLRSHIGAKLFLSYLALIAVGVAALTFGSQLALPSAFERHMLRMMRLTEIAPGVPGGGMMGGSGLGSAAYRTQLFLDYRQGVNDALKVAGAVALGAALVMSVVLSRGMTGQVQEMSSAAERIAAGQYQERVAVRGADELSQLAARFNDMAARLEEVESMRRRLIADVSHELRTPLTAIQGSMEGLIDGVMPGSTEIYEQVHAEVLRLNRLVNDLQELSRVEAHGFELKRESVELPAIFDTVLKRLEPLASARGIHLRLDPVPELPTIIGDEDRLVQVLSNLVSNALQYTPAGGMVVLSALSARSEVQISVHDTGAGIAPEHLPRVFDRFYRIDRSRTRQGAGGSGVGLTIARALIEAHGGRIWVESPGAGQGSTFTFTVPINY